MFDLPLFPECFLQGYLVTDQYVRVQTLEVDAPSSPRSWRGSPRCARCWFSG